MSAQSVLFDAPGPRAKRRILLTNGIGLLIIAGLLTYLIVALANKGQLTGAKWDDFVRPDAWQFYLLPGLANTLKAAAVAIVTSMVFGMIFGMVRLSHNAALRTVCATIVEFCRAVPVLLMMIFFNILFSRIGAIEARDAPFLAVVVALTLYNGSVVAELVRSGVHGLPRGQREAGMAIGLTRRQSLLNIEVPQALLAMLPALISQFVVILKDSALGYIISYNELLFNARLIGSGGGNMLPALIVAAGVFIVINFGLGVLAQKASALLSFRTRGRAKVLAVPNLVAGSDTISKP